MDYVDDRETLDNDHSLVISPTKIKSGHSRHHNTYVCKHQNSAPVCSPITSSFWPTETIPLI